MAKSKKKIVSLARAPLGDVAPLQHGTVRQDTPPPLGKIILRGDSGNDKWLGAMAELLPAGLPTAPNSSAAVDDDTRLLWLGPDEWLLWTAEGKRAAMREGLQAAAQGHHAAVVDVSDYYTIIRLSNIGDSGGGGGNNHSDNGGVNALLAHGCPLDLREKHFPVGSCAQSHFRNANILLYRREDGYDVQIRWSFAQYLWDYFAQVGELLGEL